MVGTLSPRLFVAGRYDSEVCVRCNRGFCSIFLRLPAVPRANVKVPRRARDAAVRHAARPAVGLRAKMRQDKVRAGVAVSYLPKNEGRFIKSTPEEAA